MTPEDADYFRALLDEGDIYYFSNFLVFSIRNSYRPCPNEYMLKFDKKTRIEKTVDASNMFPLDKFHFINHTEMESRIQNKVILTDMIGVLVKAGNLEERYSNQKMVKLKKLYFEDEVLNSISVTLWGELAMKFDEQKVLEESKKKSVIIICAGMMVTTYAGKTILSSTSASKIYLDLQIPEVDQLKRRIIQPRALQIMPRRQVKFTNPDEETMRNKKTIAELLLLDMHRDAHQKFTCKAKIKSIDVVDGWWYASCPICNRATKPWKDLNECSQCGVINQEPIPCYKLNATVEDGTGHALFTIFGRQAEQMVGISTTTIISMKDSNRYVLPQMIIDVFPVYHIFQVSINLNNKKMKSICFKVLKIFDDVKHAEVKSEGQLETPQMEKQVVEEKKSEEILSQEFTDFNIHDNKQSTQSESDTKVHTPQKSKSIVWKRRTRHIKLEHSDASNSNDQPTSTSLMQNIKQKKRGTISMEEPPHHIKKQRKINVSNIEKGKEQEYFY
ncbi:replication factor A 51 kDa subunit-like isoform X2 [Tripterygium wilfordii]|nr:replication factor A 51 kDa subunit-like isoform X2 [Tripterygium wilfordii]